MNKVCHISSVHGRYDIRIFEKECVSLAKAGYDVTYLINDSNGYEENKNVKIKSINFKYGNRINRILSSKKAFLKKALEIDADIYHFHDPELLPLGYKLKKKGKIVIYDSHEDVPRQILAKYWIPKIIRRLTSNIFEIYENFIAKQLDSIITPTPHIFDRFYKINDNTIELSNFPLLHEFRNQSSDKKTKKTACYIGGISKNRGIIQIAEATNKKDIELVLCGKFESEDFKKEILANYSNINYLGVVDRIKIAEVVGQSAFGFVTLLPTPNHINSYPIKMFEYMAGGIPVIASDFPLWVDIVQGNDCGVCVNPYDVNEISTAIESLISNEERAVEMGRKGKKAVFKKYNWNAEEEKLLILYNKICS